MIAKRFAICVLSVALALTPAFARKKKPAPSTHPVAVEQMAPDEKAGHALNRLAFGPRPGDVDRVRNMGLGKWIDQQLHPESIPENPTLEAKLQPLETLRMSSSELVRKYPPNIVVKQMIEGHLPWPTDPETRTLTQKLADKYRDKFSGGAQTPQLTPEQALATLSDKERAVLQSGTPADKLALIAALPIGKQFDVVTSLPMPQRKRLFAAASPSLRRKLMAFAGPQRVVHQDLADAKIYRAVYSNRQLEEVLTDFWYNHFNVFLDKGADRFLVTAYERDAIRPFILGKFQDLLTATAKSPAMLFYLDNFQSVRADTNQGQIEGMQSMRPGQQQQAKRGLNENYGRELLELHTLGVDGGYTQKDVTEVARCFTGWTVRRPRLGGGFAFNAAQHDPGEKHVLGVTIPAGGGIQDGYKVIDILAHHPATARFISKSLAVRFVSDTPPAALVDRMAATFSRTGGDLREVMRTMIDSPEFWAKSVYRAKIKSPFEMVLSALRATDADIDFTNIVTSQLKELGEPLYRKVEPTGYSNESSEWMNSAALLGRMNFALNLTASKVPGVKAELPATSDASVMGRALLGAELTPDSRMIVEKGLAQPPSPAPSPDSDEVEGMADPKPSGSHPPAAALMAGLTLGSPDFQRR